ncbi:MAG: alpha/beta hydrolase [Pirellulales bacterium]|nr:alpha/beta hydrolase [Pirellulales bacterium]
MPNERQPADAPADGGPAQPQMPRPRTARRHIAWRVARLALIPLVAYLLVVVLMMLFEESFIFFPSRFPEGNWNPPGLDFEGVFFEADDGTTLHGWYVPHDRPRAAVLYCHGNAGNITHRADILHVLHDRVGVSVFIFDYRGYGRSRGEPNEASVLADARAARQWLADREAIEQTDVVLMGRSLGGGVAVDLAARDGARALVLESTFSSMPDVAAHHYPWLPVRWMMRTRFDSAAKIASYHGPLLQSHGEADTIVPFESGRRLFEAANEPKQFVTLPGLGHNDSLPRSYYDQLTAFLGEPPEPAEKDEGFLETVENSLVFVPARYPQGDWHPAGLRFEDAWFRAADGTKLHGWYVPRQDPLGVVLFCHGNGDNVSYTADLLRVLHKQVGVSVLAFDYRGFGRSEGTPDEPGVLADARAARAWLAERANVAEKEIVLMGHSLGGAVAVDLAAKDGARALVLDGTFSSMPEVAAHHYPRLPVRILVRSKFASAEKIGAYQGPLLQSHGEADPIVPIEFGRRLFEAAHEPKQFIPFPKRGHEFPPPEYYDRLRQFLERLQ